MTTTRYIVADTFRSARKLLTDMVVLLPEGTVIDLMKRPDSYTATLRDGSVIKAVPMCSLLNIAKSRCVAQ